MTVVDKPEITNMQHCDNPRTIIYECDILSLYTLFNWEQAGVLQFYMMPLLPNINEYTDVIFWL